VKSGLYVMIITGLLSTGTAAHAFGNEADQLQDLKKDFGPVLKLEGKAKEKSMRQPAQAGFQTDADRCDECQW